MLHVLLFSFLFSFPVIASTKTSNAGFMTARDLLRGDPSSNIFLQNNRNSAVTVYGLYVRQFAYVTPGSDCTTATIMFPDIPNNMLPNITAGSVVTPTVIAAGKSAMLGSSLLYNMIYQANYYVHQNITSSPPGCSLPGCTWGDDVTTYNWCIYLGALSPVMTTTGYTANVPPTVTAASSGGDYDYNLISSYQYLGPISCNDQTLACTVASAQTQAFS